MKPVHPGYNVIAAYFSAWSLHQAAAKLKQAISAAGSAKIYKTRSPADLLFFIDKTTELINAVSQLMEDKSKLDIAILSSEQAALTWSLKEYSHYCGWHQDDTPWHFFPRHLTQKEFIDPYGALKKILRYLSRQEWETTLKDLLHHALSPVSVYEFDDTISLVDISLMLHKLLEATHLIEVRAIRDDEHGHRPKWKDHTRQEEEEQCGDDKEKELTIEQLAQMHIKEFFLFFGEEGAKEELWSMLKRSLSNADDQTPAIDRSNMIFVYEQVTELIDDIHALHMQQQTDKQKTNRK